MSDFQGWIQNILNRSKEDEGNPLEEVSQSELELELEALKTRIEVIEAEIDEIESKFRMSIKDLNRDGPQSARSKAEAERLKQRYVHLERKWRHLRTKLTVYYTLRELKSRDADELDILEPRSDLDLREQKAEVDIHDDDFFEELDTAIQTVLTQTDTMDTHISESAGIPPSSQPPPANLISPSSLAGNMSVNEILSDNPGAIDDEPSLREELSPTPYTLWQFPKSEVLSYFYYFTDEIYTQDESKFTTLDDQLTLMGRNRGGLEVGIFDRDRMVEQTWKIIMDGLNIDNYPALIVAEGPIGIQDINEQSETFSPNDVEFAILENGIISKKILQDSDETRDFLNTLFDAARDNEIESQMRREKVTESLTIAKDEIQNLFSVQGSV